MNEAEERINDQGNTNVTVQSQGYVHPSTIQLRLDTQFILSNFDTYLRGSKLIIEQNENGDLKTKKVKLGEALANDVGIQALMNRLTLILNPAVVQGNYHEAFWRYEMGQIRLSIATSVMENLVKWGIKEDNYREICDAMMSCIKAFLSRLINNEERKSYGLSMQSLERITGASEKKKFRIFGGRGE